MECDYDIMKTKPRVRPIKSVTKATVAVAPPVRIIREEPIISQRQTHTHTQSSWDRLELGEQEEQEEEPMDYGEDASFLSQYKYLGRLGAASCQKFQTSEFLPNNLTVLNESGCSLKSSRQLRLGSSKQKKQRSRPILRNNSSGRPTANGSKRHLQMNRELLNPWINSNLWKSWDKGGRKQFLSQCKKLLGENTKTCNGSGPKTTQLGLHQRRKKEKSSAQQKQNDAEFMDAIWKIVSAATSKKLKRDKVVGAIKVFLDYNAPHAAALISDIWTILDTSTFARNNDPQSAREIFFQLTREINHLFYLLYQEKFDSETLGDAQIMVESKIYHQRFIRLKTKSYFKQQKFNLFREEPEGYGKLVAELSAPLSKKKCSYALTVVQSLIGASHLDPNRVLDIVLEAFERQPNCSIFIPLLNYLKPLQSTICEILVFKLRNVESIRTLLILKALLIQHEILSLDTIYAWLSPDDRLIEKYKDKEMNDAVDYALQSMKVRLDGKDPNAGANEDDEECGDDESYTENQKLLLCKALLDVGDWKNAEAVLNKHPRFAFTASPPVAKSLVRLINYMIEPLYSTISDWGSRKRPRRPYHSKHNHRVPHRIEGYDDLQRYIPMLLAIGPYIHCDPVLVFKLVRIIRFYLDGVQSKPKTELSYIFINVLDEVILPALCYMDGNCGVAIEVWSVMQYYPYEVRFQLYASWKSEERLRFHPTLLRKRIDLVKQIKQLMRRLSKENVKLMGRHLGKLSHSMPAVVFDYVLSQVQLFDNLIFPVIEALKYLSPLGYDVLGYCLLEALSPSDPRSGQSSKLSMMLTPNRPRTKHDGSTIAPWIQSLASFAGSICKKYTLDLVPLLQYLANQLKATQSLDLLLLKEIVQKMSGIEAAEDVTTEQLDAMAGGELLKSEAGYFGQVRTARKSATRLRDAVSVNDLAVTLCILMAQQRNRIIYDESTLDLHTKLVGKLYDQCQDTLVQFCTFLAASCTLDEYANKIPPVETLLDQFHLDSDVVFSLWRPLFAHQISTKFEDSRRTAKAHKKFNKAVLESKYIEASAFVLDPITEIVKNYLPLTWEDISPQFFVTFWSLSLGDLYVPNDSYIREIQRIKQMSIANNENKDQSSLKRRKEDERCSLLIDKLQEEQKRQKEHQLRVMAKLMSEKETWFAPRSQKSAKNEAVTAFLQLCVFPRCVYTAPDALYCAQFITTIHMLSTPNFSTLICYDRVFCDIIYTVTSCTENEANRYGRFLNALLGTVMKWHSSKSVFDKECANYPGFVTRFRVANTCTNDSLDHVDYENYRHVCHKWHYKITKCIIVCLESKDFTQIRNSLIVLKEVLPNFPRVLNLAHAIEKWVERVRGEQKDKRADLFALATSYIGQLKSKLPSLMKEEEFHQKAAETKIPAKISPVCAELKNDTPPKGSETPKEKDKVSPAAVPETPVKVEDKDGSPVKPAKTPKLEEKIDKEAPTLPTPPVPQSKPIEARTVKLKSGGKVSDSKTPTKSKRSESKSSTKEKDKKRRRIDSNAKDSPTAKSNSTTPTPSPKHHPEIKKEST